ncbi:MAG: hypothetical protein AAFV53_24490, partial [Myxococcota bacterium]
MSERNTGLFLPGHVSPDVIAEVFWSAPGLDASFFTGAEAPRVGHGDRDGQPFTHVGLRLFELGGLLLMDQLAIPGPDSIEIHLGNTLSTHAESALYVFYDEELGAGGVARFASGQLTLRRCFDARGLAPMRRDLDEEVVLEGLDPSDWIWKPSSDLIEAEMSVIVGGGIRDDDDIEALIAMAAAAAAAIAINASMSSSSRIPPPTMTD